MTLVMPQNIINHFLKNKSKKLVKLSKLITQQPKTINNPNIIDIISETSCKLLKTISQAKMVSQVGGVGKNSTSPLYSETTKTENNFMLIEVMH